MDKNKIALFVAAAMLAGNMAVFAEENVSESTEDVSILETAGETENGNLPDIEESGDETVQPEEPESEPEKSDDTDSNDTDPNEPESENTEKNTESVTAGSDNQEKDVPESNIKEQVSTAEDDEVKTSDKIDEIKQLFKDVKEDSAGYLKELKKMFGKIDLPDRNEVLSKLAEIKKKLKDFTIDVFVKGVNIDFEQYGNVKPVIKNDRTLAPVRAITEALGADVKWDAETDTITVTKGNIVITMKIGSTSADVSGTETELDTAPEIVDGRTLVPMRFIAESMDLNVDWDEASSSIIIE